ncbi:23S rRNA (pseudouridine(1915)-N(3))-methyltransferase RlmH [Flavilitoribacter nigricans]|uniref:Ribosomal RNA large subunit methyltransferase H n=1 Tax=Flavilitoribacter nigricans (strain ATCC 23147 / DSM 23189 / NBRC 102662 / NCIMB 1420 / SS-2) TaxID=1122177 RepID=A0A2D0MZ59_FLAN2|nr:23S rRNA (pseudouridine(1915)-N(3))-methyltransferase RlmH [Flavilitoribacter nigricans]PHN01406.1 23S rRNA (pseudouridine(1915)-N(3))-methyltransferase RlmH [Flavilitoribacter nigricans DSM 23189 = NBRC 102662]
MKVLFWVIGKTNEKYLNAGIEIYAKRLGHYLPFEMEVLPDVRQAKHLSADQLKQKEGEYLLNRLKTDDLLILLDENGKQFGSVDFAAYLDRQLQMPYRRLIFQVGGAFGFSDAVYQRANAKLALSKMTFSHQMVRLFFLEQLYRAMTILRNEPYHNS